MHLRWWLIKLYLRISVVMPLKEEHRLRKLANMVLMKIFGTKRYKVEIACSRAYRYG
jgi:hypothetical protein